MVINGENRPIAVMAIDTRVLLTKFQAMTVGEMFTYQQLSDFIGRDVRGPAYGNLSSARRAALRDGIVIGTVQKVGVKRLDDVEIVKVGASTFQRVHRATRKAIRVVSCVKDFDGLPKEVQVKHNATMSQLSVLAHITSTQSSKKLEGKVSELGGSLPLARTLKELS